MNDSDRLQLLKVVSKKMETQVEGARALILKKQSASRSRSLEEGHSRLRLVRIHGYRVSGTVKIAAADIAAVHVCVSRIGMSAEYDQADRQPQRFQLPAAPLVKQTCKRAGIMAGIGLDAEVDAIIGGERGVDRQKSREERKDRDDWTSIDAFHVSLASVANSLAITAVCKNPT
jgi:hypothetical protein